MRVAPSDLRHCPARAKENERNGKKKLTQDTSYNTEASILY